MIETLLAPGSIIELAMRSCVFGNNFHVYFPLGPSSLSVVVAQPEERFANRTQKVLCVGVIGQTQSAWFERMKCFLNVPVCTYVLHFSCWAQYTDFLFYFLFSFL